MHYATLILNKEKYQSVSITNNLHMMWISKLSCSFLSFAYIKGAALCTTFELWGISGR